MARGIGRFDRRKRPGEDTEVIPAVKVDPVTGAIRVPAVTDAVAGEIPVTADPDVELDDAHLVSDIGPADADPDDNAEHGRDDRLAKIRAQAAHAATVLWQRVVVLAGVLATWLAGQLRIRLPQLGRWLRPRLTRLGAAIAAGLLLCSSYPRFNWWWAAVIAFAVLAWVLTRPATTVIGGFGYGVLFGLAFYLPLIRWISILVGTVPLAALVLLCSVFPGIFGLTAVVVRRLPGWPIWFAVLWAAQEWLKSTVPFGDSRGVWSLPARRPARFCRWSGWAAFRCSRWRSC
jgi:apolipoprotein N-acyltransferase